MPTLPTLGKDVITNVNPVYWSVKEIASFIYCNLPGIPEPFLTRSYLKDKKNLVVFRERTANFFIL